MGLADSFRAVVDQFGGADDYDDYDDYYSNEALSEPVDPAGESPRYTPPARERAGRPLAVVRPPQLGFSLVSPQDFDDAQEIAKRLRADTPVIVDLQGCGRELSKRLTDFCSGLAYALDGRVQYIGESVVLLVPHNVELTSDASSGLCERRFFNQV
jgi:cell division inhibitor SepF